VCVVLASEGYPEAAVVGDQISGLEKACENGAVVFQAGTKKNVRGELTTAGGRVLGVTASGPTLQGAIDKAYAAAGDISFRGMQYRRDIGAKGLRRW
jgi:phosphoribosylamine--glycine ligase